jgi:RNA methyltransferase, TrmH family
MVSFVSLCKNRAFLTPDTAFGQANIMNTGLSKGQIQFIKELQQKEGRSSQGLFIVEGEKMLDELMGSVFKVDTVYHVADYDVANIRDGIKRVQISQKELERISTLKTPNKVLATAFIPGNAPLTSDKLIYCCNIQDPGNMGTIIRIANWYGIQDLVLTEGSVDVYSPKVVQATMGAIFRVNCRYDDGFDQLRQLKYAGYMIYGAEMQGDSLQNVNFKDRSVLIMGSESHGIPAEAKQIIDTFVTIPKKGESDSLNVGVACGIICQKMIFN